MAEGAGVAVPLAILGLEVDGIEREPAPEHALPAGARLAIEDNDTTGRFMGQDFEAIEVTGEREVTFTLAAR